MNGQMMNYSKYQESLKNMVSTESVLKYRIDYKGLIAYAKSKNVRPCDLSKDEQKRFII